MGTVSEWREVLISGGLWGGLMMLLRVFEPRAAGSKDPALYLNLLRFASAGFSYGLLVVFGFRAFRWPLATITVPTLAAFVLIAISYGKRFKRLQSNNPSISA